MKYLFSLLLALNTSYIFAQDTLQTVNTFKNLKKGIYKSYEDFVNNKPSYSDSFAVIIDTSFKFYDNGKTDTIIEGVTYKIIDSEQKVKRAFCFYDGKDLYLDITRGFSLRFKKFYSAIDFIGKFPFIEISSKKPVRLLGYLFLGSVTDALIDAAISKKKHIILFINKDGDLLQATDTSIWFLLKKDKELLEQFNAEKETNIEVYKKYLIKINQKYSS